MSQEQDSKVRATAYRLWEEAGCPEGSGQDFWYRAVELTASPAAPEAPVAAAPEAPAVGTEPKPKAHAKAKAPASAKPKIAKPKAGTKVRV